MIKKQNIHFVVLALLIVIFNKGYCICDFPNCEPCDIVWENVCYKYFSLCNVWTQARDSCTAWGGDLVSLSSQQELDIVSLLSHDIAWTSLNNIGANGGVFSWGDMTPITSIVQPTSSANEQCGIILPRNPNNTLEMRYCGECQYYICSKTVACGGQTLFIDGRCFDLYDSNVTRNQASAVCEQDGSYLASILSMKEESLLNLVLNFVVDSYWISLINQSSAVTWLDGNGVSYTNSLLSQSDSKNGSLECVYVTSVNNVVEWRYGDCNYEYYRFMCTIGAVEIPPLGLHYSILSSTTVFLSWSEIPVEYRHSPITQYTLTYEVIGSEQVGGVVQVDGGSFEYVETSLQPGVKYLFSLSADTRVNTSPKVTLLVRTDEEINEEISTVFVNGDSAFISWQPFANLYQYNYASSYFVQIVENGPGTSVMDEVTDLNAYHINRLTPSTMYRITITNSKLNPSRVRGPHYFTTTLGEILHPLYLVLSHVNSTSIVASWSSPPLDTRDTITHFSLTYSPLEIEVEDRNVVLSADNLTYTIVGLEEYITYSVTVESYTVLKGKIGESVEEITTLESVPIGMPRDLAATPISASSLLITWLPPVLTEINGKLTEFTLIYSSTKDNGPKDVEMAITATEGWNNYYFILQGLSYGGPDFNLSLAANNALGRGPVASITAPTLHSGSSPPRQLHTTNVTANSIEVAWYSPEEEKIDGVAEVYTLTYQGYPLDNSLHEMQFQYTNSTSLQVANLENLEENTTYTIQVFLTASAIISQPATLVVQTEDTAPSAPVQNLTTKEASPFAVLVSWEPTPLQHVNGELLYYNITTEYTDPVNTKNIPELDDNFTRINITDKELILLKNLWYEVNFTVTVIPYTLRGFGPPASTTFYLIPESAPIVVDPERDEFLAGKNVSELARNITCEASGNPTPRIQWYRRNGTLINPENNPGDPYTLVITEEDLTSETTEYVCIATNRNGEYMREVFITVIGESVSLDVLNDTLNLVEEQETISRGQAVNVVTLVDVGLDSTPNVSDITDNSTNSTNISSNANVLLASEILLPVTTRLEEDTLDTKSSEDIFRVNVKAIEVSLEIQNPETRFNPEVNGCEYNEAFYDTERSTANSIVALEALVPKIVYTNERENITNFTITRDNSFLEAVNINMSLANASKTISFPYFTENISRERVVVPTELLLNNSNSSQIYSLVTTTIIKSINNTNNSVISISITQRSENYTYVLNQLTKEITLFFPSEPAPVGKKFVCLYLNAELGKWSGDGVRFIEYDEENSTVMCATNHLSSFSVLIETKEEEVSETERILLSTVSYTLLSISFLCLLATLVIFMKGGIKFISSSVNILYLNQILALLFATGLFLFGIETAARINTIMCTMVAVLLQYSWTAVMSWSLCIGINIFISVFRDSLSGSKLLVMLIILGWGFPAPFVISSLGVSQWSNYLNEDTERCYTSTDEWLIWLFLGPIYLIIVVNLFIFISVMCRLFCILKAKRKHQKGNDLSDVKVMLSKAIVATFLLGLPWIVSLVKLLTHILDRAYFEDDLPISIIDKVINWSFIILNSPIGLAWLIIMMITYKGWQAKQTKTDNSQKSIDKTTNSKMYSLPKPVDRSMKSRTTVQDTELGQVDNNLLDSSVHYNAHSDLTSQQTTTLPMQTSNSTHFPGKAFDSIRITKRVLPSSSISLDNMKKILTKTGLTSSTIICNEALHGESFVLDSEDMEYKL